MTATTAVRTSTSTFTATTMAKVAILIDTGYLVALINQKDSLHAQAKTLARSWEKSGQALVTTDAVLIEFANFFARSPLRALAASWLRRLRQCVHPPVRPLAAA